MEDFPLAMAITGHGWVDGGAVESLPSVVGDKDGQKKKGRVIQKKRDFLFFQILDEIGGQWNCLML